MSVRGPLGIRAGSVRGPFGIHSRGVQGSFGLHSRSVRNPKPLQPKTQPRGGLSRPPLTTMPTGFYTIYLL